MVDSSAVVVTCWCSVRQYRPLSYTFNLPRRIFPGVVDLELTRGYDIVSGHKYYAEENLVRDLRGRMLHRHWFEVNMISLLMQIRLYESARQMLCSKYCSICRSRYHHWIATTLFFTISGQFQFAFGLMRPCCIRQAQPLGHKTSGTIYILEQLQFLGL